MARAFDGARGAVEWAVVEGAAVVGADIFDREQFAIAVDDEDVDAVDLDMAPRTLRELGDGADLGARTHGLDAIGILPSAGASTPRGTSAGVASLRCVWHRAGLVRRLLAVLLAPVALVGVPGAARAAPSAVPSRPTPLALASASTPPACPTTAELDGSLLNRSVRGMVNRANRGTAEDRFIAYLVLGIVADGDSTTIAVCDPDLVSARQPMGSISGLALTPPLGDAVGFGLRLRGAPLADRATGAAVGDRFVLPTAVGPRTTIDLAVRTAGGVRTVRLGPFAAAPTAVRVAGTSAAPVVIAELVDGQALPVPITPLEPVATKITTAVDGRSTLRIRVRTSPGAFVSASTPERSDDFRIGGFDEDGGLRVADETGRATVEVRDLSRRDREVELDVIDADRRVTSTGTCRLRWKTSVLRDVRCTLKPASGTALAARSLRGVPAGLPASGTTGPLAAVRAILHAVRSRQSPGHPRFRAVGVRPVGSAARADSARPAVAAITATEVTRLDEEATFELEESVGLFGDVNGDGRPDFGVSDPLGGASVFLSQPGGWRSIPLELDEVGDARAIADITGDGTDEFQVEYDSRIISGQRGWATAAPSSIDLRKRAGLAPGDLDLSTGLDSAIGLAGDDIPPIPFRDATGDARPELGIASPSRAGIAIFASQDLRLGVRTALPPFLATTVKDDLAALDTVVASLGAEGDAGLPRGTTAGASTVTVRGDVAVAQTSTVVSGRAGSSPTVRTTLSLGRFDGGAPWAFSPPTPPLDLAGNATLVDLDPASGQTLVLSTGESCNARNACVSRIRRVDAAGKIVGEVSTRSRSVGLTASFADDGPDADALPEVLIHDGDASYGDAAPRPGVDGPVALWRSTVSVANLSALPVLGAGTAPYVVIGPLQRWTAPNGTRSFSANVLRERRGVLSTAITLLGPLR